LINDYYIRMWKTGNTKRRDVLPRRAFFQKEDDEGARLDPRSILLSRNSLCCYLFHSICPFSLRHAVARYRASKDADSRKRF